MSDKKFTYEDLAQVAFQIITHAGEAKSEAMLAIYDAKEKNLILHQNIWKKQILKSI